MSTNEVLEMLDALAEGRMGLEEVAQLFRQHKWAYRKQRKDESYPDWIGEQLNDSSDLHLPGSFDDVSAALHRNQITIEQYDTLREAALEAIRAQIEAESK